MDNINEHIDELINKFLDKTSTIQEEEELLMWVKADSKHKEYFVQQQKIVSLVQNSKADFDTEGELLDVLSQITVPEKKTRSLFYTLSSIAASIVLLLGTWYFLSKPNAVVEPEQFITYVADSSFQEFVLADSSHITLQKDASLVVYAFTDSTRNVTLNGTAYFDVAKNPQKRFRITVDFVEVEVLGTSFEILQNPQDSSIRVSVIEGRVSVTNLLNSQNAILTKNMNITMYKHSKSEQKEFSNTNFLVWKTGKLEFVDTPVSQALKEIGTYYNKSFVLENNSLQKALLNASFDNLSFDDVKTVLALSLSVQVIENDSTVSVQSINQ